jgi:hypothetical protein
MAAGSIDTGNSDVIYKHKDAFYAKKFGRSIRTIQHWRTAGAPLDDGGAMEAFIRMKELNKRGGKRPASELKAPEVTPEELGAVKRGAEAALQRLVEQEARCSAELSAAQVPQADQQLVEMLMSRWLKVSGELRSFNLAIEKFRKETGAVVSREAVLKVTEWLAVWWRMGCERFCIHSAPTLAAISEPAEVQWMLETKLAETVWGALKDASLKAPGDIDQLLAIDLVKILHAEGAAALPPSALTDA